MPETRSGEKETPSVSATVEKDAREGGWASTEAGLGGRGCTLTHRHKINTFFSLHRRPGDNHEIMWPARASERHRNVWLPLRFVITHPRRAKAPPSVATCCMSLHRRQLSETSTLAIPPQVIGSIIARPSWITRIYYMIRRRLSSLISFGSNTFLTIVI